MSIKVELAEKKVQWVALNFKDGDLTGCASAQKYNNPDYLRHVSKGRRNNDEMMDILIQYILVMRKIQKIDIVNVEGFAPQLEEPNTTA